MRWGLADGENKDSKPLAVKPVGVVAVGETPSLTGEFVGEIHGVLDHTQGHPPGNQHKKGPICLWVVVEVTESWLRAEQEVLFLLGPCPHIQHHHTVTWVTLPWQIPKAPPLNVTGSPRQRNMAQMKEQIKTPEKERRDKDIDNLSDAEFKILVIRMLIDMIDFSRK